MKNLSPHSLVDNKKPQDQFVYTDLSTIFPGYTFDFREVESAAGKKTRKKVSSYLDVEEVGEGGYVYSEPGMYDNVWVFDVSSMHPSSIKALNLFGDTLKNIKEKITRCKKCNNLSEGDLCEGCKAKNRDKKISLALHKKKKYVTKVFGL